MMDNHDYSPMILSRRRFGPGYRPSPSREEIVCAAVVLGNAAVRFRSHRFTGTVAEVGRDNCRGEGAQVRGGVIVGWTGLQCHPRRSRTVRSSRGAGVRPKRCGRGRREGRSRAALGVVLRPRANRRVAGPAQWSIPEGRPAGRAARLGVGVIPEWSGCGGGSRRSVRGLRDRRQPGG